VRPRLKLLVIEPLPTATTLVMRYVRIKAVSGGFT
jgi:hypothetical protein